jgi:predicted NUDIX family NTP pyrophosphohydrolase
MKGIDPAYGYATFDSSEPPVMISKNKKSAGILAYRRGASGLEIFLMHPGGPFWEQKDLGAWSIPKGEPGDNESEETAARREFEEETGFKITGGLIPLKPIRQKSGKRVQAWALEQDMDASAIKSNHFEMEWPPRSGRLQQFPEMDRAAWFSVEEARKKMFEGQAALIDELLEILPAL